MGTGCHAAGTGVPRTLTEKHEEKQGQGEPRGPASSSPVLDVLEGLGVVDGKHTQEVSSSGHVLVSRGARRLLAHASRMSSRLVSPSITTCFFLPEDRTSGAHSRPPLLGWGDVPLPGTSPAPSPGPTRRGQPPTEHIADKPTSGFTARGSSTTPVRGGVTLIHKVGPDELDGQGISPTPPAPTFLRIDPEVHSCLTSLGCRGRFWSASWLLSSESAGPSPGLSLPGFTLEVPPRLGSGLTGVCILP